MRNWKVFASVAIAVLLGLSVAYAAQNKKAGDAKAAKPKVVKVPAPYSLVASLSDEQKQKIADLITKANEAKKAIDDKCKEDCMAVLTDAQKAELKAAQEKEKAEREKAAAEKKKAAEAKETAKPK